MAEDDWDNKSIRDAIEHLVSTYEGGVSGEIQLACEQCESPIEEVMAAWLLSELTYDFQMEGCPVYFGCANERRWPTEYDESGVVIMCQSLVDRYRVDFLIFASVVGKTAWLAVECDGHDYHERTKEQARRDRSRDRWMALNDIHVMRFTGQEIYENAKLCANQVSQQIEKALRG